MRRLRTSRIVAIYCPLSYISPMNNESSWITAFGAPSPNLARDLSDKVDSLAAAGRFTTKDITYISKLARPVLSGRFSAPAERLNRLRRLCQTWDIEIKPAEIKSHRPIIGPVIVALKRLIFPMLKILLKDFVKSQREFNAATIMLLSEMCNENQSADKDSSAESVKRP